MSEPEKWSYANRPNVRLFEWQRKATNKLLQGGFAIPLEQGMGQTLMTFAREAAMVALGRTLRDPLLGHPLAPEFFNYEREEQRLICRENDRKYKRESRSHRVFSLDKRCGDCPACALGRTITGLEWLEMEIPPCLKPKK